MKKLIVLVIFAVIMMSAGQVLAAPTSNPMVEMIEALKAEIDVIAARVLNLETVAHKSEKFYTKDFGSFNATKSIGSTVIYGCEDQDVAIAGGLVEYSGNISNWRTVRNVPNDAEYNNHGWITTVVNEIENGTFTLRVKCLDM